MIAYAKSLLVAACLVALSFTAGASAQASDKTADSNLKFMMPMRDGLRLTTDIFTPKISDGKKLPVIFWKTPYNINELTSTTGGNNYDETEGVVARNSIHHSTKYPSSITLPVLQ